MIPPIGGDTTAYCSVCLQTQFFFRINLHKLECAICRHTLHIRRPDVREFRCPKCGGEPSSYLAGYICTLCNYDWEP